VEAAGALMGLIRRLDEGQMMPRGWGYCWPDLPSYRVVIAPLGLNVLFAFARWGREWLAYDAATRLHRDWPPQELAD
jgi:hypothetical protein